MTATNCQSEALVPNRDIPTPILRKYFVGLDALVAELLNQILCEALAPEPGIDLLLLTFIRRKLDGRNSTCVFIETVSLNLLEGRSRNRCDHFFSPLRSGDEDGEIAPPFVTLLKPCFSTSFLMRAL